MPSAPGPDGSALRSMAPKFRAPTAQLSAHTVVSPLTTPHPTRIRNKSMGSNCHWDAHLYDGQGRRRMPSWDALVSSSSPRFCVVVQPVQQAHRMHSNTAILGARTANRKRTTAPASSSHDTHTTAHRTHLTFNDDGDEIPEECSSDGINASRHHDGGLHQPRQRTHNERHKPTKPRPIALAEMGLHQVRGATELKWHIPSAGDVRDEADCP
jgi:hypothetical protein